MLDKYIRLFLEVSFADTLKSIVAQNSQNSVEQDDVNNLEIKKAEEERLKRLARARNNITPQEMSDLVNHASGNPSSAFRLAGIHKGKNRPRGRS